MYHTVKRNRIMRKTVARWMSYFWRATFGCFVRPRAKSYGNGVNDSDETIVFVHDVYGTKEKEN